MGRRQAGVACARGAQFAAELADIRGFVRENGVRLSMHPGQYTVLNAPRPEVVRAASVQHLATPIRAQLAEPVGIVDLVERLHPTPAVGGFPEAAALPVIPALEGLDRGWYAGPVGWCDAAGDGEFCVALRSALLEADTVHCYAGVGVVGDSDPADGRRHLIALQPAGEALLDRRAGGAVAVLAAEVDALDDRRRAALADALPALDDLLEALARRRDPIAHTAPIRLA